MNIKSLSAGSQNKPVNTPTLNVKPIPATPTPSPAPATKEAEQLTFIDNVTYPCGCKASEGSPTYCPTHGKPVETAIDINKLITTAEAKLKLQSIAEKLQTYAGKPGFNPFMWAKQTRFYELVEAVNSGAELDTPTIKQIMLLPDDPNPIAPRIRIGEVG